MNGQSWKRFLAVVVLGITAEVLQVAGFAVAVSDPAQKSRVRAASAQCARIFGGNGATSQWVFVDPAGDLAYKATPNGDQIMDFSFAGYMGGGVRIPDVSAQRVVSPSGGDDTATIQAAIDAVSSMNLANGLRGAVLLGPGIFNCSKSLQVTSSGVVLRGSGSGASGTTVKMIGEPHTLITIHGAGTWQTVGSGASFTDSYVPSGATSINVNSASGLNVGDTVLITRPSTPAWIHFMGMDTLVRDGQPQTWLSGNIRTDRVIKAVAGNKITLDAPLSDSFDGGLLNPPGGSISKYNFAGRISQAGVESLRVVAPPLDVDISEPQYELLSMDAVIDGWARDITAEDTINSVSIGRTAKQVTLDAVNINHSIDHSRSDAPADFAITGTQVFLNRCSSKGEGSWYLVTQSQATGPNVALNFSAVGHKAIEPHQRWATGLLLDNCQIPDGGLNLKNRGFDGSGHGWAIGWGVAWNCVTRTLVIQQPPGSQNFAIGCTGTPQRASMPGGDGTLLPQGILDSQGAPVLPTSLYLAQLCQRLGPQALANVGYGAPAPSITSVTVSGKNLVVSGQNFDSGAVLMLDGIDRRTTRQDAGTLIGRKVAKQIPRGQTVAVQVRNSDGQSSNTIAFTRQ